MSKQEVNQKILENLSSLFKVDHFNGSDEVYYLCVSSSIEYRLHQFYRFTYVVVEKNDSKKEVTLNWFFHKNDSLLQKVYENFYDMYINDVFCSHLEDRVKYEIF